MFQSQTLEDDCPSDVDERLWTYVRASRALLQAHSHQLLEHEKELLQLIGHRMSQKLSMVGAVPLDDMAHHRKCQIVVVDDHNKFRAALRMLLAAYEDMKVIGEACNGEQAVMLAEVCHPDVVIMDINMPKMNGIAATGLIKSHRPETIVIGLSFCDDAIFRKALLDAGASTVIAKQAAEEQLYPAINTYWTQRSVLGVGADV